MLYRQGLESVFDARAQSDTHEKKKNSLKDAHRHPKWISLNYKTTRECFPNVMD